MPASAESAPAIKNNRKIIHVIVVNIIILLIMILILLSILLYIRFCRPGPRPGLRAFEIPSRAKSRPGQVLGPGLARLFLARLGPAWGFRLEPAHHYIQVLPLFLALNFFRTFSLCTTLAFVLFYVF